MTATIKDAASARGQLLTAQLLSDQGFSEVAITVPEDQLAAPSLYWYERDPELFHTEREAMNHFFLPFRPDRLVDDRMSWLGSHASGIAGSQRIWHLQLVEDHDHSHRQDYGNSINVFSVEPDFIFK
ncbi:hypothetical protein [Synechococcus lacustris]|uniref:hypothetical protein n=1 Tax=Synechococcus lacustris TaxID=2116544 RepID=UPI000D0B5F10|nr:hypothetical protein [Synechococcus lacustris]